MIEIAASLLAADPLRLGDEIQSVETLVSRLHLDVMDGHMVSNFALGTSAIQAIPDSWQRDIHLMVERPEVVAKWLQLRAGDTVYFHAKTVTNLLQFIEDLTTFGAVPGLVIDLDFDLDKNYEVLSQVDHFLVMGVKPGFSGQHMNESTVSRVKWLRDRLPQASIAVDGGVNDINAQFLVCAGANILVAGSYLFTAKDRKFAIQNLLSTNV